MKVSTLNCKMPKREVLMDWKWWIALILVVPYVSDFAVRLFKSSLFLSVLKTRSCDITWPTRNELFFIILVFTEKHLGAFFVSFFLRVQEVPNSWRWITDASSCLGFSFWYHMYPFEIQITCSESYSSCAVPLPSYNLYTSNCFLFRWKQSFMDR